MEYKLKKQLSGTISSSVRLSDVAQVLLERLLALPDGSLIEFSEEGEFCELERAGYLRLVTKRRPPDGEVSSCECMVAPWQLWPFHRKRDVDINPQGFINPDLFVGLPFSLPGTVQGAAWLEELDFVDPYTADLAEVQNLAESAPSESARFWLRGLVAARERIHGSH